MGCICSSKGEGIRQGANSQRCTGLGVPPSFHMNMSKQQIFFVFLLQASISGAGQIRVRFTFTAMLCAKVTLSPACVEIVAKVLKLESLACLSLFLLYSSRETTLLMNTLFFYLFFFFFRNFTSMNSTKHEKYFIFSY